jgi:Zn-dependent protease with chaperone function
MKALAFFFGIVALFSALSATLDGQQADPAVVGYRQLADRDLRLATIGYHLARANAPYCKLKSRNPGWVLHDIAQYADAKGAAQVFAFRQPVSVLAVVEGGAAAMAGVRDGDGLVARNGTGWDWEALRAKRLTSERIDGIRAEIQFLLEAGEGISIAFATAQGERTISLRPEAVCKSDFWVDVRKKRDAGADGERVRVTSGLIDYVRDDDELAAVVAHELSHNLLGHRDRISAAKTGKTRLVRATEEEADRLSVWLMANAGYDPEAAITFWERYGAETGLGIFTAPTHYRWQDRVAMLRQEIEAMSAAGIAGGPRDPPLLAAHRAG